MWSTIILFHITVRHSPSFQKMKFLAIAFLMTVLVGSTFGANFWCGHGAVSAGTCCWNGEMESAGWKHSSVDNFVSSSGCPSGKTRKTVIAVPGTSHKCYSCARSAWGISKSNFASSMKSDWQYEKRTIIIITIARKV